MEILLLEDDDHLRFTYEQVLEDAGHSVRAMGSMRSACTSILDTPPDLLILDLFIEGEHSIPVADLAGYAVPEADVIYVTGSSQFPNGELYQISPNASWVLRKPVDLAQLRDLVAHAAQSGRHASHPPRPTH